MSFLESVTNLIKSNNWNTSHILPIAMKWLEYLLFLINLHFDDAAEYIKTVSSFKLLEHNHDFNAEFQQKVT